MCSILSSVGVREYSHFVRRIEGSREGRRERKALRAGSSVAAEAATYNDSCAADGVGLSTLKTSPD